TWTKGISKVAANLGSHVAISIRHITNLDLHPLIEGGLPPCEIGQPDSVRQIPLPRRGYNCQPEHNLTVRHTQAAQVISQRGRQYANAAGLLAEVDLIACAR